MSRTVNCVKLGREAEGLDYAPWPGELGKKIYENISKEAWQLCVVDWYACERSSGCLKQLVVIAMDGMRRGNDRIDAIPVCNAHDGAYISWVLKLI